MYLSDVEAGGETRFTKLNISVTPKKGSAILWPSVHSDDPWKTEDLTYHEACTVTKGEKSAGACDQAMELGSNVRAAKRSANAPVRASRTRAANFWIHNFEFQKMLQNGCDNEDYFQDFLLEDRQRMVGRRRGAKGVEDLPQERAAKTLHVDSRM